MNTLILIAAALLPAPPELPTLTVTADDTPITQSCRVVIPPDTVIQDANHDGVLHVRAADVTIEFADGSVLRGDDAKARPDEYEGYGIRIEGQKNVAVRKARISGFRTGLWATQAEGLVLEEIDASDNRRQHLGSDRLIEEQHDWTSAHANDRGEWLKNYGAALYVEQSGRVTVRGCRVWHGQNALCLSRVNDSKVYDNDVSFNSGWGIALWRSCRNVISRNAVDFCIRGYSHEIYNRGQDSAGILLFEQNCDNVIVENSVTHGGDGIFAFAGSEATSEAPAPTPDFNYARRGNNDNLFIANDCSYAAAHGIETTFSFGNRVLGNRLVSNSICGVWAGGSQDTLIANNTIEDNGGMGYGLERGGVNIDHGRSNRIVHNQFKDNRCGVHVWWDKPSPNRTPSPWQTANQPDWSGTLIAGNTFTGEPLAFHVRGIGEVTLGPNTLTGVEKELLVEGEPKIVHSEQAPPAVEMPQYPVCGDKRPVGARPELRGRDQIIMTRWGPWDHRTPLIRPLSPGRKDVYELRQLPGTPTVTLSGDGVSGRLLLPADKGTPPRYEVSAGAPGVYPYTLDIKAGDFTEQDRGTLGNMQWDVTLFPFTTKPTADLEAWRAEAKGPQAQSLQLDRMEIVRAPHTPIGRAFSESGSTVVPNESFGIIARTSVPMKRGKWIIRLIHDDGVRITANGKPIFDDWKTRWSPSRGTAKLDLDADQTVELVVEYYQLGWGCVLSVHIEAAE